MPPTLEAGGFFSDNLKCYFYNNLLYFFEVLHFSLYTCEY